MTDATPPDRLDNDTDVDLDGPVTEATARQMLKEVRRFRRDRPFAIIAIGVALAASGFSAFTVVQQKHDRCTSGNATRAAIIRNMDNNLKAVGLDIEHPPTDEQLAQLPPEYRDRVKAQFDGLRAARNDPALGQKKCSYV